VTVSEDDDIPAICERWLADKKRVAWLRGQLANHPLYPDTDTQVGQIFCNVIYAWGKDLVARGVKPQAAMIEDDLPAWEAAMRTYDWGSPVV